MLTCTTLPFTPPTSLQPTLHHLLQKTCITPQDIRTIKAIHARELHAREKPTLLSLHLYTRAGLMREARLLFDRMPDPTLVSWTILMSGYARHGPATETIAIFQNMLQDPTAASCRPDPFVFAVVMRACTVIGDLNAGRELHCQIIKTQAAIDLFVENALLTMYASCGSIRDSVAVFNRIQRPDLVTWSSMVSGYVQNGHDEEGLRLFCQMGEAGIQPDVFALSMAIGASAHLSYRDFGTQVHCCIIKTGFNSHLFLDNSLMEFYARCGDSDASRQVFDAMPERNLVSWNTIITGHVHNVHYHEALMIFRALTDDDFDCDEFTITSVLQAVTGLGSLDHGREIHGYVIRAGLESNVYVISSLLDMYIECCSESEILGRYSNVPIKLFDHAQQFDEFIVAGLLRSCAVRLDLEMGKMLHSCVMKLNLKQDHYIISSLINMYAKCGATEAAQWVFSGIKDLGTVPWSAIITGHWQNGLFEQVLWLFRQMQFDCVKANEFTYTSVLLACIALGDIRGGKELHCNILRNGYGTTASVMNSLLKLYAEIGCMQQALKLSSSIPETEISWDILIQACARIGDSGMVLKLFQRIHQSGWALDHISASYILCSCANPVLLNAGVQAQAYLTKTGILTDPNMSNSLIKMYSGSGEIRHSAKAFKKMPEKNSASWTSMVSANVAHGQPSQALDLFIQMQRKSKMPDSNTFVSVLKACAQTGLVGKAFRIFNLMDGNYGIEPSAEHYSCMVDVLGRARLFEDAEAFIEGVIPFNPDYRIWKTLLSSCRIHGNVKMAKYAAEKLLKLEPNNHAAGLILEQVLLTIGKWDDVSKLKNRIKFKIPSSSWIEIRNFIYEFTSNETPSEEVLAKVDEIERRMEESGYKADKNHWLHNAEEEYRQTRFHPHTEITALAFGLVQLPEGMPIRILKSMRMCGDCHSACKFISTFVGRDVVIKDSFRFHHFRGGKCSCNDTW
ncbi:pentatricopeptide repeat-containing protein At5g04780, mitochondrial-like [Magnolia sinica]|uniref:pentatricopeptide repeat-containing protein At5g04780, mitochondrial-like n=1 Tax=Magnolia sinica TaxID=86752 RepID=UPI00265A8900|nr:pentatricopeptide repeat-containing protein At5g04780, mitochondrial-like [Magnolia sinica]